MMAAWRYIRLLLTNLLVRISASRHWNGQGMG